ncbi:D-aminoacyl-tRNA deacylase [Desulforudis sp. 1088]|uniref:D-aminoacyl-tRNA deacylase n=1 Tax=unclassified Candidatus Desulforudis TaxID=2635950 RepID=UPI00347171DF
MRAVVQRVEKGSVQVGGKTVAAIGPGMVILLGVGREDQVDDALFLADKIVGLRIFEDGQGKLNRSVIETGGEILVVSQFTLYGDCRKGRRPSFTAAAEPGKAVKLYEAFASRCEELGVRTARGQFREHMRVEIINDGPVTLLLDSRREF